MPDALKDGDVVGRRLFGQEEWEHSDGKLSVGLNHFYDTRLELDLSVDILGNGEPERKRVRELTQLADEEARDRALPTAFEGWAAILLKDLKFPGWNRGVRLVPDEKKKNPFHAEISRDDFRGKAQAYTFATAMADRFQRKGRYVGPVRD